MLPDDFRAQLLDGAVPLVPVTRLGARGRGGLYIASGWCVSIVSRKSRYLRRDAERFQTLLTGAREHYGRDLRGHVMVRTAPVCSKAKAWLAEQGVSLEAL